MGSREMALSEGESGYRTFVKKSELFGPGSSELCYIAAEDITTIKYLSCHSSQQFNP
jgi:hypothetical protein